MQRDNLDFKNMSVSKLFTKQLFPTLLGMVSSALFTVVDGIFVGRGIGSDAIAAVNIAAPIFMIAAGLGLMFGMGGGILASINLSRGKLVVANINVTRSIVMLTIVSIIMGILFWENWWGHFLRRYRFLILAGLVLLYTACMVRRDGNLACGGGGRCYYNNPYFAMQKEGLVLIYL